MQAAVISYHLEATEIESEWQIIQTAQKSSAKFEILYNRYHERIFRFVHQRTNGMEEAADITQQVFIKAYQKLPTYQFKGVPFSAWLFRIASNDLAQYFRDKNKHHIVNIEDINDVYELMDEMAMPAGRQDKDHSESRLNALTSLLESMPYEDVQLIEMRFFEKRSFGEIAEILATSKATAKMRLYRLLERVKKEITTK